jgi:hypothetical protein
MCGQGQKLEKKVFTKKTFAENKCGLLGILY